MTDLGALVVIVGTAGFVLIAVAWLLRALRELGGVR